MKAVQRWLSGVTVLIMLAGGMLAASAQEATPGPQPPAPNAGSPLPGQYAFYPVEVAQPGGDLPGDPQVQLVQITDQLEEPVNVAAPMDGTGRIFVVERGGKIKIVQAGGTVLPEPFLDWTGWTMSAFLEQGLLGLAFHPNFAQNGVFYINYTDVLRSGDV